MELLWKLLGKYRGALVLSLVLATVHQLASLVEPQITRILIDKYITHAGDFAPQDFVRGVGLLLLAGVGAAFVARTALAFEDYNTASVVKKAGTKLYADIIRHVFSLDYLVLLDQRSGELLGKLQKARVDLETFVHNAISYVFIPLVGLIFVIGYAYYVNVWAGLAYSLIVPVVGVSLSLISKQIRQVHAAIVAQTTELSGSTTETIRNVELVTSLGLAEQEIGRLNLTNEEVLKLDLKKIAITKRLDFVRGTLIQALRASLLLLMAWLVATQQITLGEMLTLLFYSFFVFNPLNNLGNAINAYQETKASMGAIQTLLDIQPKAKPANARAVNELNRIEVRDVSFGFEEEKAALKDVSWILERGKVKALVGPSGSGKTTMVKMILGLYEPRQGTVFYNDVPQDELDFDSLRQRIGYVSQDTQLFAGTIRENLQFVKPNATDEECLEAMRQAAILTLLDRGKEGLDTKIGEGGIKLSGGERQRLAIARSLLRNPDLIVFDEATSSLDLLTEKDILETIENIKKERPDLMMLVIAHRLSTVTSADEILVFEKGVVVETGRHDELLKKDGLYARLWSEQTRAEEKELV